MDVSLEIHCDRCGSANYSITAGEGARLTCNDCGHDLGSIAELRDAAETLARDQSAEALRRGLDAFIRRGGDA
jgi:uncharacterized Zn ribbon protein